MVEGSGLLGVHNVPLVKEVVVAELSSSGSSRIDRRGERERERERGGRGAKGEPSEERARRGVKKGLTGREGGGKGRIRDCEFGWVRDVQSSSLQASVQLTLFLKNEPEMLISSQRTTVTYSVVQAASGEGGQANAQVEKRMQGRQSSSSRGRAGAQATRVPNPAPVEQGPGAG